MSGRATPSGDVDPATERVVGLVSGGYHLAVYACEIDDPPGHHLGYFKLCLSQPDNYWEADCLIKGCAKATFTSPEEAIDEAIWRAEEFARQLPSASEFIIYRVSGLSPL
jgi:hypothetical protein